jgi:hypothetical protein
MAKRRDGALSTDAHAARYPLLLELVWLSLFAAVIVGRSLKEVSQLLQVLMVVMVL